LRLLTGGLFPLPPTLFHFPTQLLGTLPRTLHSLTDKTLI
jgi:hypothetical protein